MSLRWIQFAAPPPGLTAPGDSDNADDFLTRRFGMSPATGIKSALEYQHVIASFTERSLILDREKK